MNDIISGYLEDYLVGCNYKTTRHCVESWHAKLTDIDKGYIFENALKIHNTMNDINNRNYINEAILFMKEVILNDMLSMESKRILPFESVYLRIPATYGTDLCLYIQSSSVYSRCPYYSVNIFRYIIDRYCRIVPNNANVVYKFACVALNIKRDNRKLFALVYKLFFKYYPISEDTLFKSIIKIFIENKIWSKNISIWFSYCEKYWDCRIKDKINNGMLLKYVRNYCDKNKCKIRYNIRNIIEKKVIIGELPVIINDKIDRKRGYTTHLSMESDGHIDVLFMERYEEFMEIFRRTVIDIDIDERLLYTADNIVSLFINVGRQCSDLFVL